MKNKVKYILKKSGLSSTSIRIEILSILLENQALSSYDLKTKLGDFDRITFYRNIKVLKKIKIIKEIYLENQSFFVLNLKNDQNESKSHSVYFFCTYCNKMSILNKSKKINLGIDSEYLVERSSSYVIGRCKLCA